MPGGIGWGGGGTSDAEYVGPNPHAQPSEFENLIAKHLYAKVEIVVKSLTAA